MKKNKFITAFVSMVLAATLGISSLAACKGKGCKPGEHAYRWTVTKEATCSAVGSQQGVCGICGDVKTEKIEIDPDAHSYGEWAITPPSTSAAGTAVKTCGLNSEHKLEVTLPAITAEGTGYISSETVTPATAASEGKQHLVIDTPVGELAFDVTLPKREVQNVEDAVTLAASLGSLVRSNSGYYQQSIDGIKIQFDTVYGDDYTHVLEGSPTGTDDRKSEWWYSRDEEGKLFGVFFESYNALVSDPNDPEGGLHSERLTTDPQAVMGVVEKSILGYGYESGGGFQRTYGAEDTLLSYYTKATVSSELGNAVKYSDKFQKKADGSIEAEFQYSYYENPNFCRYTVSFELYPNGVIKNLTVKTEVVRPFLIEEDESGEKVFYPDGDVVFAEIYDTDAEGNPLYEYDNDGKPIYETDANGDPVYKKDASGNFVLDRNGDKIRKNKGPAHGKWYDYDHEYISTRTLVYENQTQKTAEDVVEKNEYNSDVLYISSFDVRYGGRVIGEEAVSMPTNQSITLSIANVQPTTASLDYDPLELYVRTESRDVPITDNFSDTPYNIIGFFIRSDNTVRINSQRGGEVTLVLKTVGGKCEKEIKIDFERGAPSTIFAEAYTYTVGGGEGKYVWSEYTVDNPVTIYVGQKLLIRTKASDEEAAYADTSFTADCTNTNIGFTETEFEGQQVVEAVATAPGTYRVYVQYKKTGIETGAGKSYTSFNVIVEEAPALSTILTGEYEGTLRYIKSGEQTVAADVKVTFSYTTNWRSGTIDMVIGEGNTCKYSYSYNDATKELTLTYREGITGETYDFTFAVNEAYYIELTHSTGFGDIKETIVLSRPKVTE